MKRIRATLDDSLAILKWVLAVLLVFVLFVILIQTGQNKDRTDRNYKLGLENNTYHRTIACVLSVPLASRTDDYISNCYLKAEAHNGVTVDHFGNK